MTVPANQLTPRPGSVLWEVGGSLFVAGVTAYAAVRAVRLAHGNTVAIAGAAGGVPSGFVLPFSDCVVLYLYYCALRLLSIYCVVPF